MSFYVTSNSFLLRKSLEKKIDLFFNKHNFTIGPNSEKGLSIDTVRRMNISVVRRRYFRGLTDEHITSQLSLHNTCEIMTSTNFDIYQNTSIIVKILLLLFLVHPRIVERHH